MDDIGYRIRLERERLGLKQDALGVAPKTQRFYESGERSPDSEYLKVFSTLGADVLFVLTGRRSAGTLSPDEATLLENYRAVSDERKGSLVEMAAALSHWQRCKHNHGSR